MGCGFESHGAHPAPSRRLPGAVGDGVRRGTGLLHLGKIGGKQVRAAGLWL